MSFSQTDRLVTSLTSEEFLDIIEIEDEILSFDTEKKELVNSKIKLKEYKNLDTWVNLVLGHSNTNLENWNIQTSKGQEIFTILDGYKKVEELQKGDILKHIDGLSIHVKKIQIVEKHVVFLHIESTEENYYINGTLFKN